MFWKSVSLSSCYTHKRTPLIQSVISPMFQARAESKENMETKNIPLFTAPTHLPNTVIHCMRGTFANDLVVQIWHKKIAVLLRHCVCQQGCVNLVYKHYTYSVCGSCMNLCVVLRVVWMLMCVQLFSLLSAPGESCFSLASFWNKELFVIFILLHQQEKNSHKTKKTDTCFCKLLLMFLTLGVGTAGWATISSFRCDAIRFWIIQQDTW